MQSSSEKPASSTMPRLKAGPLEPWTIREKLCLASAVRHNGDQNWVTVSRSMKPFLDPNRPLERVSQKNCALQYAELLENVDPPKRVKRGDKDAKETSEDIIVRKLTYQRIEELKRIVAAEREKFTELKRQQEMLRKGLLDERLPEMWAEVVAKKRASEEAEAALKAANEEAARAAKDAIRINASSPAAATSPSTISKMSSPPRMSSLFAAAGTSAVGIAAAAEEPSFSSSVSVSAEGIVNEGAASSKTPSTPPQPPALKKSSLVTKLLLSPTNPPMPIPPLPEEKPIEEALKINDVVFNQSSDLTSRETSIAIAKEKESTEKFLEPGPAQQDLASAESKQESTKKTLSDVTSKSDGEVSENKKIEEKISDDNSGPKSNPEEVEPEKIEALLSDVLETPDPEDPEVKASPDHEVTLEDIENYKNDQMSKKEEKTLTKKEVAEEESAPVHETNVEIAKSEPIKEKVEAGVDDSESEADPELEAASDVQDGAKPNSVLSGATPSESETEDTMSNAASPRAEGIGGKAPIRKAGSDIGSSIAGPPSSCPNSPASISQSSDIEADEKAHRAWKKSIMLVWRNASHHKYANFFLAPVTDEIAPGYSVVIKRPIDLKTIKSKIDNGQISNTAEFQRDIMLMFTNAVMYNNSDQDIYAMTNEMYRDVLEDIEQFVSTQLMVQAAMASSSASDSMSSPAVAPSSSRLRGRPSRAQKLAEAAIEEAEGDAKSSSQNSTSKRKSYIEESTKTKKRRSHKVDV